MVRRYRRFALALLVTLAAFGCGRISWENQRFRRTMSDIDAEMAAGRYAIAARDLGQVLAQNPSSDEAAFLLGVCEQARGRNQAAAEAWARVAPGSPFSSRAVEARMSLLANGGRFAAAEQLIDDAARDPRHDGSALRVLLLPTFTVQGRLAEARRLIEDRWQHLRTTGEETSELAINLARLHLEIEADQYPVETVRAQLEQAAQMAPDDDRVWLGLANLALRTGNHEEAERRLVACLARRPDDFAVWCARLEQGMATGRVEIVREAVAHLPSDKATPAQVDRIDAFLAAKQGDTARERQALERVIAIEPADRAALARLTGLAGPPDRSAALRQHEAGINSLTARYRQLYDRNQPIRDALEMGELAEKLGRHFEAVAYLTVAAVGSFHRDDAKRQLARLKRSERFHNPSNKTLAEILAATGGINPK